MFAEVIVNSNCDEDGTYIDGSTKRTFEWREMSRPQIHGYDMTSVAVLPASVSNPSDSVTDGVGSVARLVTGSEEKVLRVLTTPIGVLKGLHTLAGNPVLLHIPPDSTVEKYFENR